MAQPRHVVIERAPANYAAYSTDLPDCIATGKTKEETMANMREAIAMHLEVSREDGLPSPSRRAATVAAYATVDGYR